MCDIEKPGGAETVCGTGTARAAEAVCDGGAVGEGERDAAVPAADEQDALEERDELSGQRMVKIEPGPGEGDEELALRRLFQDAVSGLEPSLGSLEHLHRAVPARRARRRQVVVGAAAAAVLIGTAIPAFVHVAASGGISAANPVNAGHGEQSQGGTGIETGTEGGQSTKAPTSSASHGPGDGAFSAGKAQSPGTGATGGGQPDSQGEKPSDTPRCAVDQLAVTAVRTAAPGSGGRVQGSFRTVNVSDRNCLVDGSGIVGFEARGAADPGRISVVRHTAGDGGSGLPDPSQELSSLVLKPNEGYEVKFVWVPSDTCPSSPVTPTPTPTAPSEPPVTPTPTPTPTGGTATPETSAGTNSGGTGTGTGTGTGPAAEAEDGTGLGPQLVLDDGAPAEGSVLVSHTAEPGGPMAAATIPNACSGTIYRTGVLAAS
ncbi:hypothetical protein ACFW2Y_00355 [Streptomyces sp. NPDC058877]|uniref:hypothetical protein n=1 Tax=Streptomyces sp. NPDC058877 TaxID=3346665 RepID=UPI003680BF70